MALTRVCMLAVLLQHTLRTGSRLLYGVLLQHQDALPVYPWENFCDGECVRLYQGEFCVDTGLWESCDKHDRLYGAVNIFIKRNRATLPERAVGRGRQRSTRIQGRGGTGEREQVRSFHYIVVQSY